MVETVNRQQGCRGLLPNKPLQADEARMVQLGTFTHRGAPSFRVLVTIRAGFAAERQYRLGGSRLPAPETNLTHRPIGAREVV